MGSFTAPLTVTWHPADKEFEADKPFEFHAVDKDQGLFCRIEKGDRSDLASVPFPFRMLIPKLGTDAQGAFIHDKGYRTGKITARFFNVITGETFEKDYDVNKGMIDSLYYEAMIVLKTNCIRREVIRAGLLLGGWYTWNKYRARDAVQRKVHHLEA